MEKDKLKKMLLLDLCAFTASLCAPGAREDVLEDYRLAYSLAERQHLPNRKAYKDLLERLYHTGFHRFFFQTKYSFTQNCQNF